MKLKLNGEPASIFFRYTKSWQDKWGNIRQDVLDKMNRQLTILTRGTTRQVVKTLPPNVTTCYIVKGYDVPPFGHEEDAVLFGLGRTWRRPIEQHDRELARHMAFASAIHPFARSARKRLWDFYERRGMEVDRIEAQADGPPKFFYKPLDWDIQLYDPTPLPSRHKGKKLRERPVIDVTPVAPVDQQETVQVNRDIEEDGE
jgi:hypothetical protein